MLTGRIVGCPPTFRLHIQEEAAHFPLCSFTHRRQVLVSLLITELNKVKVQLQTRRRRRTLFPPTVGAQTAVKDKDRFSSVKVKSDLFVAHFMHRTIQSASYKIKALQQGAEKALKICKMI